MEHYTEKKLVFAQGPAVVKKAAFDPILGIKAPQGSYVLERKVEMLQWVENFTLIPGDEERYEATYELRWSNKPIYSSGFLNKLFYFNPKSMALDSKKFFADGCQVGAFYLNDRQLQTLAMRPDCEAKPMSAQQINSCLQEQCAEEDTNDDLNLYTEFQFDGNQYFYASRKGMSYQQVTGQQKQIIDSCKNHTL